MHTKYSHLSTRELVDLELHVNGADTLDYLTEVTKRLRELEAEKESDNYEKRLRHEGRRK
jgi:uncharacterized protein DUF1104